MTSSENLPSDPLFPRTENKPHDQTIPLQQPFDALQPESTNASDPDNRNPLEHRIEPKSETGDESYSLADSPEHLDSDEQPAWQKVEQVRPILTPTPDPLARPNPKPVKTSESLIGCNLVVFVASICVMVLELTASRLIARHVGSSLYTWTSVIGVVLLGITIGNFIGGWLADRFDPGKLIAWLFFLASAACFSVLWLDQIVATGSRPESMGWPAWVFLTVAQMFFLPATILGTISPMVASVALAKRRSTGMTVGSVYAWGAMGSIVGTFLTGFYLIDTFGTKAIIGGTSGTLAVVGILVASGQTIFRSAVALGWLQFLLITTTAAAMTEETGRAIGGWIGHAIDSHDDAVARLEEWYRGSDFQLPNQSRKELLEHCRNRSLDGLNEDGYRKLSRWLRSGLRRDLTDDIRKSVEDAIQNNSRNSIYVDAWENHAGDLATHIHELGILLWLRSDLTGEYHDESNYSYINVSDTFEDGESVKQLQLDKLMHSYFNPNDPARLYYEYENIYAEITNRATAGWDRTTTVKVPSFSGLEKILPNLPVWVSYNAADSSLQAAGAASESRHIELLRASRFGEYWLAVEQLGKKTRREDWGGFSREDLDQLPAGAADDSFFKTHISFDGTFKTLNAYEELSEQDVTRLCAAGDAQSEIMWRSVVNEIVLKSRSTSTFFIGGGGFVFPRWIEIHYPHSTRIDVAELDPAVKTAVQKTMGLPPDDETLIRTLIGDARNVTDDLLSEQTKSDAAGELFDYDFIYGDAFNDLGVPWHLTTLEYTQKIAKLLNPNHGVYLVNLIDIWPRTVFPPGDVDVSDQPGIANLPADVFGRYLNIEEWEMFTDIPGFEVQPMPDGTHRLGIRGRMSTDTADQLVALAPGHAEYRQAIKDLYSRSNLTESGRFLSSYVNTIAQVFPNIYVFSTEAGPPSPWRDTFIIAASQSLLPLHDLPLTGQHWQIAPFATRVKKDGQAVDAAQMEALLQTAQGLILTDDYAPVDTLLKPVITDQD